MTQITVSAGSAVNVTLPANNRLIIGGSGVYRVGPLGTSQRPTVDQLIDTTTTVGPFEDSCVVRIAANLGATYEVIAPTDALDSRGLPALVSGAGRGYEIGLALFGDSLTENGFFSSVVSRPQNFPDTAVDNFERAWGWSTWVGPLSMQRVRVVKNYAVQTNGLVVPGTSPAGYPISVQITTALADPDFANATHAAFVVGTNDAATTKSDGTYATVQECAYELLAQTARIDKPIILVSAPPRGSSVTTQVGGGMALWAWLQEWRHACRQIAAQSRGRITFVDGYSLGNSPTAKPDVMAANRTYDNIHWNNAYAYLVGDAVVSAVLPSGIGGNLDLWPNNSYAGDTNASLLDQAFSNPVFGTTAGGFGTGTIASGLTVTAIAGGTHTGSSIANPNGLGNMQRLAITAASAGDGIDVATASAHAAGGTFLEAGDVAYAQALVTVNGGGIYPRNLFFRLQAIVSGTTYNRLLWEANASNEVALPFSGARTMLLRTPPFVMPAGSLTSLVVKFRPQFAAAGNCTIDIGNLEIRRVRANDAYS